MDGRTAHLGFLGGDEDHAKSAASTIDSRRGRILEHADALHIVGVDSIEITLHAIDKHKGATAGSDGVDIATNANGTRADGLAIGHGDGQTGHLSLQTTRDIGIAAVLQHVTADRRHGADDVALLLHAITDDDQLVEVVHIVFQLHVELTAIDLMVLFLKAEIGEAKLVSILRVNGILSFLVGDNTLSGSLVINAHTDQRSTRLALYRATEHIGGRSRGQSSQQHKQQQRIHLFTFFKSHFHLFVE